MAIHGKRRHVKRLSAPSIMPIKKKGNKYLKKAGAGRHPKDASMPLIVAIRDLLGLARDRREAKLILNSKQVFVDGTPVVDLGFPIGLMDVITFAKTGASYRIAVDKHRFVAVPVAAAETKFKYCKVVGKKLVKGGRIQLAFHDGRSLLIEKEEDRFRIGDTVRLAVPKQKVESFIKLDKGARVYVYDGKHKGHVALVNEVRERTGSSVPVVVLNDESGDFSTRKDYVLAVDESFKKP